MPSDAAHDTVLRPLLADGQPRVWSLLVTMFGDLAQGDTDTLAGPVLSQMTDVMGIRAEAVRVALHRLRNETWITSTKVGRTAVHQLTEFGRRESRRVSPLFYSKLSDFADAWILVVLDEAHGLDRSAIARAGLVSVAPRVFVARSDAEVPRNAVVTEGGTVPDWIRAHLRWPDLGADFTALMGELAQVRRHLDMHPDLDPIATAALRSLIVHRWRRLVLRQPFLPPSLIGADWPGHQCRHAICEVLGELPKPSLQALQAA